MSRLEGGITSPDGRVGFVGLAGGVVTAIDLATGQVLWRKDGAGAPVAASERHLVVVDPDKLCVLDAATGDVAAESRSAPTEALSQGLRSGLVAARDTARGVHVSWRLRRLHESGIVRENATAPTVEDGALDIDVATGAAQSTAPALELLQAASAVIDQDPQFLVTTAPGAGTELDVKLQALDRPAGIPIWETSIGSVQATRPRPKRQKA